MLRGLVLLLLLGALAAVSTAAAQTPAPAPMSIDTYRTKIHNQHRWTNRALVNRCRPRKTLDQFTRTPLVDVHRWWRDDRVRWAKHKHHRAQARLSRCSPRGLGRELAAKLYGWTGDQWAALDAIVMRESGWNPCRHYPSTTNCGYTGENACGIPQAVPCSKLRVTWCHAPTLGACSAELQIRWMLRYIAGRYGSPAAALANGSTY